MSQVTVGISQNIPLRDPNDPNLSWDIFRPLQGVQLSFEHTSGSVLIQLTGFDFRYLSGPSHMGIDLIVTIDGQTHGQPTRFSPDTSLRTFQVAITGYPAGTHTVGINVRSALLNGPPAAVTVYGQATFSVDDQAVFFTFGPLIPPSLVCGETRVVALDVSVSQSADLPVVLSVSGGDLQVVPSNPLIGAGGSSTQITLVGVTAGTDVVTASAPGVTGAHLTVPVLPVLSRLEPPSGPPGTAVTLVGSGFSPGASAELEQPNDPRSKGPVYIDSNHLALSSGVTVGWVEGPLSISVVSGGQTSGQLTFTITPLPQVQWPTFTGVAKSVGVSPSGRVSVYVDANLGSEAVRNALDLLAAADQVVAANDTIFGFTGGNVSVIVFAMGGRTDGKGGADHNGCDYHVGGAIEVCASYGNSERVIALFEAELSECSMGGNLCGVSTGEALSRWCAMVIGNNSLTDYATAPTWYNTPVSNTQLVSPHAPKGGPGGGPGGGKFGLADYVDDTSQTDRDPLATGCGMAFLSWMISQGYKLSTIARTMVSLGDQGTLAQLYATLTNDHAEKAWPNFVAALHGRVVADDDPFGSLPAALQLRAPQPIDYARAGEVISAVLADLAAGSSPRVISDRVHEILDQSRRSSSAEHFARVCSAQPRVLLPTSL
jgi:hypothetical protein